MIDLSNFTTKSFRKEISISTFIDSCVDIPRFIKCCENCPSYGKYWSCPPLNFSSEAIWQKYTTILLVGKKIILPEDIRQNVYSTVEMTDICNKIIAPFKHAMLLELLELEADNPGSMALSAGKCDICVVCTREKNLPCRSPKLCRHSIEALGGDVGKAIEMYFGEKLVWDQEGHLPEYLFLVGGLLL